MKIIIIFLFKKKNQGGPTDSLKLKIKDALLGMIEDG